MKKLIIICCLVMTSISAIAEETEVKWKINIEIQYNAVTRKEADRIVSEIKKEHEKSCTVEIKETKVNGDSDDVVFYNGDSILLEPINDTFLNVTTD